MRARIAIPLVMLLVGAAAMPSGAVALSGDAGRAHATVSVDGIEIAEIRVDLSPPTDSDPVPGTYEFDGFPGLGITAVRSLITKVDYWFDPAGPWNVAHFEGEECLYFDAVNHACRSFEAMLVDGIGSVPDEFATRSTEPGFEEDWIWYSVERGQVTVHLAD